MRNKPARNKPGTVAIHARNGMLRLRWRHQGKEYQLSLGKADTPLNRHTAQKTAAQIAIDIAAGHFDPTLAKYRTAPESKPPQSDAVTLFDLFIDSRQGETSGQAIASRYLPLRNNLQRFGQIQHEPGAREFVDYLRSRQSPRVANQNLSLMKSFGYWAILQGHWEQNHFEGIKPLKVSHHPNGKRSPFTIEEIRLLLSTAKTHPRWYHYHDFCMALLYLGLRPSEAIGLKWKHINWQPATITIAESLSRSPDGKTAGYARQSKTTKNQRIRVVPLHPDVLAMLQGRFNSAEPKPENLIFTTVRGYPIDDRNFCQRTWKELCQGANIPYRVPYAARHSLGSHLLESGASLAQVAAILGNRTETTARYYAHAINLPTMPGF